jgi:hypothetical protein
MIIRAVTAGVLFSILLGCASSKLTIRVDLYNADPQTVASPFNVPGLREALLTVEDGAKQIVYDRTELGKRALNAYRALTATAATITKTEVQADLFGGYFDCYTKRLQEESTRLSEEARRVETLLKAFEEETPGSLPPIDLQTSLQTFLLIVDHLSGPLNTAFENAFLSQWSAIVRSSSLENLARMNPAKPLVEPKAESLDRLQKELGHLLDAMVEMQTVQAARHRGDLSNRVPLAPAADGNTTYAAALSVLAAAGALLQPDFSLPRTSESAYLLMEEWRGESTTLVDRLQDPGDPVWREISKVENDWRWIPAFADTYSYAEGNSSVVVVRDSPVDFRVQRATNNPTALIQGQLRVTRAVANAAIAIAGANLGVSAKTPGKLGEPPTPPGAETDAAQLAAKRASLTEKAALRQQAIRAFHSNLLHIKEALLAASKNEELQTLQSRLTAVLQAAKASFAPPADPAPK